MTEGSSVESASASDSGPILLTFVIADVRGYTSFTVERGNEAAARLASTFAAIAEEVVAAREGQVIELRGDEALAVFPSPRQALSAAVELQGRFREQREIDPALPLKVGIGIDAGEAVPVKGGYRGLALNLAARLCSLAGPGEVYGSKGVVQLAQRLEGLAYVERGRVQLKGFADPVRVIQILPEEELPAGFPPLVSLVAKPSNLPLQSTPFIGREREVAQVTQSLRREEVRLLTLTGPGGSGKSRLALQAGAALLEDFERGVFFVSLASVNDPDLIVSTIASTLQVKELASQPLLDTLREYLHDKQMLLLLDNFEHLLDGAPVVSALLASCPDLKVLVSSRSVLHLAGEHDYPVPSLSVPDLKQLPDLEELSRYESVALFIQRARAVKPHFEMNSRNAPAVAEICVRLDGLPLAVELAAARSRLLPPPALLARLSSRLGLLTGGARDAPSRQQTLRAAIDWSHDLLTEGEKRLFARLSVFQGGSTLEAAETIGHLEEDLDLEVLDGLGSLVEKSLLRQEGHDAPRFLMLETIREYALERLEERGEGAEMRAAHAEHFLGVAVEAGRHLRGPEVANWLDRLEREHGNLRAALRWAIDRADAELAMRLAVSLSSFWYFRGHFGEKVGPWGPRCWRCPRHRSWQPCGSSSCRESGCWRCARATTRQHAPTLTKH
jgi:predicted ATPase/class 3 adenylate cyclase